MKNAGGLLVELGVVVLAGIVAEEFHDHSGNDDQDTSDHQVSLNRSVVESTEDWLWDATCNFSCHCLQSKKERWNMLIGLCGLIDCG